MILVSAVSFHRKVMSQHTLSDGNVLPRSAHIAVAAGAMAVSSRYHMMPDEFNGFRFHDQRQNEGDRPLSGNQLTSTSFGMLMWGYGKYACPGRFFAALEAKLVLAHVLQHYDLQLGEGTKRPPNIYFGDANFPDAKQAVLFRQRVPGRLRPGTLIC